MRIKICGLTCMEEIRAVNEIGPDYIGFVFAKESRRAVDVSRAARLREALDGRIRAVGVFVDSSMEEVLQLAESGTIDLIQLHGAQTSGYLHELKERTSLPVIRAVCMTGQDAKEQLSIWDNSEADYLLLDGGNGGEGRLFDHDRIGTVHKPFFLAGGLTPGNIADAARRVLPFAVDISSGVEYDGPITAGPRKDPQKMREAVRRIRYI